MSIKIITDSSCDLSLDIIKKYNIGLVGLNVSIDNQNYKDIEMSITEFYEKMKNSKELPKTSCPSPDIFASAYDCDEDNVIVFALTSKLSATYSTAVLGKNLFNENNSKRVEIIDTETGTVAHGLLIIKTAQLINENKLSFDEILEEIEKMKSQVKLFGTLETLDNAVKGGRISPLKGKLANALNLKGLVHVEDGIVKPIGTARGESNSLKKVVGSILEIAKDRNTDNLIINIGHANSLEKAEKVKNMLTSNFNFKEIVISEIGPAMGTYTAEGAILVSIL